MRLRPEVMSLQPVSQPHLSDPPDTCLDLRRRREHPCFQLRRDHDCFCTIVPSIGSEQLSHIICDLRRCTILSTASLMIKYDHGVFIISSELPQKFVRLPRTRWITIGVHVDFRPDPANSERFGSSQKAAHAVFEVLIRNQQNEISRHALVFRPALRWQRAFRDQSRLSSA